MITIYYPYWEAGSKWQELRYSLRSLEKHLKEDFLVCLVGDCPAWLTGVEHIAYERDPEKSALWNTNRMMQVFMERGARSTEQGDNGDLFVRMNDDIYLLRDLTLEDLKVTRIIRKNEEIRSIKSGGALWRQQVFSTIDELEQREYPGYLTESHCPELVSARKMQLVYQVFTLPKYDLLPSTLYFNLFPYARHLVDRKIQRALFYGSEGEFSHSSQDVARKCEGKWFLNHNNEGLNREMQLFIEGMFPGKSRFERD